MGLSNVHELGLTSLLYVSRSTLPINGDAEALEEIIGVATTRNPPLRVTGALVYTQLHFAQLLEGPARSIEELMASIRRDQRHRDVMVVAEHSMATRKFSAWAMAYSGPSPYLDRQIKQLISPISSKEERVRLSETLIAAMQRLHSAPG
jgi:hypothetical protein